MNQTSLSPWRVKLQRALDNNSDLAQARYIQLASVTHTGRPAVRTVVFRGFNPNNDQLLLHTDRRSEKFKQLQNNQAAEICWYFPNTREQFRLSGIANIVEPTDTLTKQQWKLLSNQAKTAYFQPLPGYTETASHYPLSKQLDIETTAANFVVIGVAVEEVDYLDLRTAPHTQLHFV